MNQGAGNTKHRASAGKKKRSALEGYKPEKIPSVKKLSRPDGRGGPPEHQD